MHERTVAHKQAVLGWLRDLATRSGADDPDSLARSLALLLDGGLADGALAADPEAARVAKEAAGRLIAVHGLPLAVTSRTGAGLARSLGHEADVRVGCAVPVIASAPFQHLHVEAGGQHIGVGVEQLTVSVAVVQELMPA